MSLLFRVIANHLKRSGYIGDPKVLFRDFEQTAEKALLAMKVHSKVLVSSRDTLLAAGPSVLPSSSTLPGVREAYELSMTVYELMVKLPPYVSAYGNQLFLAILQSYTLPPKVRKKVEIASRAYLKRPSKPRKKGQGSEVYAGFIDTYLKFAESLQAHLDVAREALAQGKEHSEEGAGATKLRVGDFTLVNTGGFPEKVMQEVADVTQKAQALLKTHGFGGVCYGEIQVTNTIHRSNVLAFYMAQNDEMFVRANVAGDTLRTVLHELGHRFEHKMLSGKGREVAQLYQRINGHEYERKVDLRSEAPKPGEEVTSKGHTYRVMGTNGVKVFLQSVEDARPAHIALEGWLQLKGGGKRETEKTDYKGFVTDYASKSPSENFAEMFSFYCMGKLPASQKQAFEDLVR